VAARAVASDALGTKSDIVRVCKDGGFEVSVALFDAPSSLCSHSSYSARSASFSNSNSSSLSLLSREPAPSSESEECSSELRSCSAAAVDMPYFAANRAVNSNFSFCCCSSNKAREDGWERLEGPTPAEGFGERDSGTFACGDGFLCGNGGIVPFVTFAGFGCWSCSSSHPPPSAFSSCCSSCESARRCRQSSRSSSSNSFICAA
jgi:hypothetical protein